MEEGAHGEWLYELLEPHVEQLVVIQMVAGGVLYHDLATASVEPQPG